MKVLQSSLSLLKTELQLLPTLCCTSGELHLLRSFILSAFLCQKITKVEYWIISFFQLYGPIDCHQASFSKIPISGHHLRG